MISIDRLSNLPENILTDILCCMEIQYAVRTSVLSKRWTRLWTRLPRLYLNADSFDDLDAFQFFLLRLMIHYDSSNLCSLKFACSDEELDNRLVSAILDYAISNRVENIWISFPELKPFHLSKFSAYFYLDNLILEGLSFEFPTPFYSVSLTSILLDGVSVKNDFTLHCPNLENFCMTDCTISSLSKIALYCRNLVKLDIQYKRVDESPKEMLVELSTPKLKSLSFSFKCESCIIVCLGSCRLTLESVSIDFYNNLTYEDILQKTDLAASLVVFLKELSYVKSLTLSAGIIKLLSVLSKLLKTLPSPFCNLKCLKVHKDVGNQSIIITPEVETFLAGASPNGAEILKGLEVLVKEKPKCVMGMY